MSVTNNNKKPNRQVITLAGMCAPLGMVSQKGTCWSSPGSIWFGKQQPNMTYDNVAEQTSVRTGRTNRYTATYCLVPPNEPNCGGVHKGESVFFVDTVSLQSRGVIMSMPVNNQRADNPSGGNDQAVMADPTNLCRTPSRTRPKDEFTPLPLDFVPHEFDVVLGRGKRKLQRPGNQRFHGLLATFLAEYGEAKTRLDKTAIVSRVVDAVRSLSPNGGFVQQKDDGTWYKVGDYSSREKVSQGFRDLLANKYKSNKHVKRQKRQASRDRIDDEVQHLVNNSSTIANTLKELESKSLHASNHEMQGLFDSVNTNLLNEMKRSDWVSSVYKNKTYARHSR